MLRMRHQLTQNRKSGHSSQKALPKLSDDWSESILPDAAICTNVR